MSDTQTVENEEFWKKRPAFVMEPNPLKRDALKKVLKQIGLVFVVGFVLLVVGEEFIVPKLSTAQAQLNNDTIKPDMLKLADSGKSQAAIWMAINYPETDAYRLDQLIAQKDSTAMLAKASLIWSTNPESAKSYIKEAAAEGNPAAVKYLSEKKPSDIGFGRFIVEYVLK